MPLSKRSAKQDEGLQITAQQSRYAVDAIDAPATKEILIKDLTISVGQRELISRATLHLVEGFKYVLIGRNGEGKTTMLRALAQQLVPGVPLNLRILLLGQTRELSAEEAIGGLQIEEITVLQHVVRSDAVRELYLKEEKVLSDAIDSQETDSTSIPRAYRTISHQRLQRKWDEGNSYAERRSGARGKNARKALLIVEEELKMSQERLAEDLSKLDATVLSQETQAVSEMLADTHTALEMMDAAAAESRARTVLLGLGFPPEKIDDSMMKLSGGWRTRCDLACALCQTADVLLLDEPSSFLDLPSIIWLENYINGDELKDTTVVTVTHDRDFADAVGQELIILRHQKLEVYKGTLSGYEHTKMKKIKWLTNMKEAQEKQKKHMESSIQGNIRAAKKTGDDKKLKQAVSKQKRLDERMGMQVNEKGHRFKLNRDHGGYHLSNRSEINIPEFDPIPKIRFPMIPADLRFPGALVNLEKVSFRYNKKSPMILNDISLTIHYGERLGLAGLNGSGKSTLVQLLDGTTTPTTGTVTRHPRVKIARFNQHVVEELAAIGQANPALTALQHLMELSQLPEKDVRGCLGSLGLQGSVVSDVPLQRLSGGQKVRVALAKLVYSPPHLLVLDEITTHLDVETIVALVPAIRDFEGAVLVVTHDRFFMRCAVEGVSPGALSSRAAMEAEEDEDSSEDDEEDVLDRHKGTVWRMFKGGLRKLDGGMEKYEEIAFKAAAKLVSKGLGKA
ncbi:ABC transporter ATP-binding protein uup-1 [Microthyrium microscopicum]|uniref:ABC transporter ATP-binding protein uup-1 n=1 Tax=Microthyrium microscopicum TaxID=703497 RepID=A0A6A6UEW7_9PEZI|nr:ABC transporter ATP-binding protein uup-1 [Microthyrium microscopicum]